MTRSGAAPRWPFMLAVFVGLLLAIVHPPLLWFVALGLVPALLGLLFECLARSWARVALGLAAVGATAVTALTVLPMSHDPPPAKRLPSIELPAALEMEVSYEPDERFEIAETFTVEREAFGEAISSARTSSDFQTAFPAVTLRDFAQGVQEELLQSGWMLTVNSNLRQRYMRIKKQAVSRFNVVPAYRANVLSVTNISAVLDLQTRGGSRTGDPPLAVSFSLLRGSVARIHAPERAIGLTYPAASSNQTRRSISRQVVTVPIDGTTTEIELDVRSPPFRNEVLVRASDLTLWAPVGWLVTAALVVANDRLRGFVSSLGKRLIGRPSERNVPKPAKKPEKPPPARRSGRRRNR